MSSIKRRPTPQFGSATKTLRSIVAESSTVPGLEEERGWARAQRPGSVGQARNEAWLSSNIQFLNHRLCAVFHNYGKAQHVLAQLSNLKALAQKILGLFHLYTRLQA